MAVGKREPSEQMEWVMTCGLAEVAGTSVLSEAQ